MYSKHAKTIKWLKSVKIRGKGIPPFADDQQSYPEITGYLLPTLLKWKETSFAKSFVTYLLSIVSKDGAIEGLDGIDRVFDTSAVLEGFMAMYELDILTDNNKLFIAIEKIKSWLESMVDPSGFMYTSTVSDNQEFYNVRAAGIIENESAAMYWKSPAFHEKWNNGIRTHYLAYGIEGMLMLGWDETAKSIIDKILSVKRVEGLIPYEMRQDWSAGRDTDVCATAQIAYLAQWFDIDVEELVQGVRAQVLPDGGVPLALNDLRASSWSAKFYLDMEHELRQS